VALEAVEAVPPHLPIGLQPVVELDERFEAEPIQPPLPVRAHLDQAGLAQDPEVLRHRRLTELEPLYEIRDRQLATEQLIEDLASARLRDHVHRRVDQHT
jgi:hypothetical protein